MSSIFALAVISLLFFAFTLFVKGASAMGQYCKLTKVAFALGY
jgi:hypothetical protein